MFKGFKTQQGKSLFENKSHGADITVSDYFVRESLLHDNGEKTKFFSQAIKIIG